MTLKDWVSVIMAVLKFPEALMKIIDLLKKTPEEQHKLIVASIEAESARLKKEGRPIVS